MRFREFIENNEPVPPGVDPTMWANDSYQRFWKAQNQAPQQPQQPPRLSLGRPLGQGQPQQSNQQQPGTIPAHQIANSMSLAISHPGAYTHYRNFRGEIKPVPRPGEI